MTRLNTLPELEVSTIDRLVVVVAHPDDESLGAGGLIARCAREGIPVQLIVVTDGSASHPGSAALTPAELARVRESELFLAAVDLAPGSEITMLGFPDGQTDEFRGQISAALSRLVPAGSTIVSTWRGDGHRDHRVVGELCAEIAANTSATLLECPIWMWHWATPDDPRVPWDDACSVRLTADELATKRTAISRHVSQIGGLEIGYSGIPVLSEAFLANFETDREIYVTSKPTANGESKSRDYFDRLYAKKDDPWSLRTRWYESRKRQITLASLPRERYESAVEIGCSTGELTAVLATRCDSYLALDISSAAVASATERTRSLAAVTVQRADATESFPDGKFDLVVLSEVAYYWDRRTLERLVAKVREHLAVDATVVVCHWRHPVEEYPLSGDEASDLIREALLLNRIAVHDETDFLLEIFSTSPESVAGREGMLR